MEDRTQIACMDFPESQEKLFQEIEEIDKLLEQIKQEGWLEP